jgi:hypothetical protein
MPNYQFALPASPTHCSLIWPILGVVFRDTFRAADHHPSSYCYRRQTIYLSIENWALANDSHLPVCANQALLARRAGDHFPNGVHFKEYLARRWIGDVACEFPHQHFGSFEGFARAPWMLPRC